MEENFDLYTPICETSQHRSASLWFTSQMDAT